MRRWVMSFTAAAVLFSGAAATADAASYKVQKGDTLYKIAQANKVSVNDLKAWNGLTSDSIYVNQVLEVSPDSKSGSSPAPSSGNVQGVSESAELYRVVKGDSLYSISRKHGVTVAQLTQWNRLKSPAIYVGQSLKVGVVAAKPAPQPAAKPAPAAEAPQAASGLYATVLTKANAVVGTPYVFGGSTTAGFDCSGFIYYAYSQAGIPISRNSSAGYYSQSTAVSNPVPGDLIFFENTYKTGISHMGIYIGGNKFLHASSRGVEVGSLDAYWSKHFVGYKRFNAVQ